MIERTHDEMRSLISPYVLGAVPPDEVAEIRSHIVTCETCLADAERYADAAASLASLVAPEELPEGFADRVLEQVAPTASVPARVPLLARWGRAITAVLAAVLVATIATLGALLVDTRGDLEQSRELALALLDASEGVELTGSRGVEAKLLTGDEGAVFVAAGLDDAPEGRIYQLWYLGEDDPVGVGTFDSSDGIAIVRVPRDFTGAGAAVTIEPAGGSAQPTTEPILASG